MEKRKWTNIKVYEAKIIEMREQGKTRQEIANALGLEKRQIKDWVNRYNRRKAGKDKDKICKRRGRARKRALRTTEEYEREIHRLEMENRLLRDFLQFTERE